MIKLTFLSNFLNHHQLPFCLEMKRSLGDGFRFVATEPIHKERLDMGYADMNSAYPFVVRSYESATAFSQAVRLSNESDVVISGAAPESFVKNRIAANKLTFRYSERIWKDGLWRMLDPRNVVSLLLRHTRFHNNQLYMLCASAYAAGDFALVGAYRGKCYKWGYFPEVKEHNLETLMRSKRGSRLSILWAGRFLEWKHPEKAIHVARFLRDNGVDFSLKCIGGGDMAEQLAAMTDLYNLRDCVDFPGFLSPDIVREEMERAEIFLFTSDTNEGWGAVLNEAMNSGCAVVASNAIGSVPFLIKDGASGFIYRNGSLNDLCDRVLRLAKNSTLRSQLGRNAYNALNEQWNARVAVQRLLGLSECLLAGNDAAELYADGPCSIARASFIL